MIVDTSALVAICLGEPERDEFVGLILGAEPASMSAASWLETAIVVDSRRDPVLSRRLDDLVESMDMAIVPVTATQAEVARGAYRDFGRGSGHPARLNFGDCLAYALAKDARRPLLFTGEDFAHTDGMSARGC